MFFPMLTLEALNLHLASALAVARPGLRYRKVEAFLLVVHATAYVSLLVVALTWQQALVFFLVHQALFGVYLGCSFAPGHKGMPVLGPEQAADPLLRQVLTSRNVTGGRVAEVLMGGLNYQIEHHLFPSMPRPQLHRAQRLVQRFCEERGVSYAQASPLATYRAVLRHLDAVGGDLRGELSQHLAS
jgi:fatty acid desaturase